MKFEIEYLTMFSNHTEKTGGYMGEDMVDYPLFFFFLSISSREIFDSTGLVIYSLQSI